MISDIRSMIQTVVANRNDQIIKWGLGIIVTLGGIVGWLVTHYVLK